MASWADMKPIPPGQRWPFKDFLRVIIGGGMASAQTETSRIRFLTQFLAWWKECLLGPERWLVERSTSQEMSNGDWTPEEIIAQRRKTGFSEAEARSWGWMFKAIWQERKFHRRAKLGGHASWTPEARIVRAAKAEARAKAKTAPKPKPEGGYITPDQVPFFLGPVNRETIFDVTGKKLIIPKKSKRKKK
jgi:hypothetical protein